jgi:hypothetical protein
MPLGMHKKEVRKSISTKLEIMSQNITEATTNVEIFSLLECYTE